MCNNICNNMCNDIVVTLGCVPTIDVDITGIVVKPTIGNPDETYSGSYSITPSPESQVLPTSGKFCSNDIQVRAIPFYEVSNDTGGTTVIIDNL